MEERHRRLSASKTSRKSGLRSLDGKATERPAGVVFDVRQQLDFVHQGAANQDCGLNKLRRHREEES